MQPITRIIDVNVYARPDEGGLMLGGYEQTPLQYGAHALPARFDIGDLPLDLAVLRGFADAVREQLPVFQRVPEEIKLRVHRGGLPTMTADGEHTVGPVPGVRGLYVAGGCCVGGLSLAPAIGEALAAGSLTARRQWICHLWHPVAKGRWTRRRSMWPAGCSTRITTGNACRRREGFGCTTVSSFPRKACPCKAGAGTQVQVMCCFAWVPAPAFARAGFALE